MGRRLQFKLLQIIRNYFLEQGFLDVLTPPVVENPGMEVHIHPFQLFSIYGQQKRDLFLHTSPEFCLKELLADEPELGNIFSLSYCFRDEPSSPHHRFQFIMLEWYRTKVNYDAIMRDVEGLIEHCFREGRRAGLPVRAGLEDSPLVVMTMQEIFQEILAIDILQFLDVSAIRDLLKNYPDVPVPSTELSWEDYFFLLYLNKIEPALKKFPLLLIKEFPAPLSALSTLKTSDPRVCERFEVYVRGLELCNCFNELRSSAELHRRFEEQAELKNNLYGYRLPPPEKFYSAMDRGLPQSAGIALGVERLLQGLFEVEKPFFY